MSDHLPNPKYLWLSLLGLVAVTVLEVALMHGPPEGEPCRAAVFAATTPYKAERAMRSPACRVRVEAGRAVPGR
ncbi:hypothetical protein QLQ15_14355 [Lysobacter sp. LF1]|uniref:Uncharacterized protein n=1 Tax=Lysobacter stagni TaxID=3045172 RepID=A0ABT6XJF9_9GAMM|nr:hypothetical protein [Lysobacter sp. LF1]MDI9240093.1 hypothetical protein [Lysobacter sp. LF1]